jgi:hypothetical protein
LVDIFVIIGFFMALIVWLILRFSSHTIKYNALAVIGGTGGWTLIAIWVVGAAGVIVARPTLLGWLIGLWWARWSTGRYRSSWGFGWFGWWSFGGWFGGFGWWSFGGWWAGGGR